VLAALVLAPADYGTYHVARVTFSPTFLEGGSFLLLPLIGGHAAIAVFFLAMGKLAIRGGSADFGRGLLIGWGLSAVATFAISVITAAVWWSDCC
jgi:hypothetical protein